ncbi:Protein CBG26457 [Caenorhabditis briggsae]
MYPWN